MIIVLLTCYVAILALFVWLRFIPFNLFWKVSPIIVALALLIGLFIPMGWGAPSGPAAVVRHSVQIAPNVTGEVIDVPVQANVPLNAGDVLFKIDPTPFQATVDQYSAQLLRDQTLLEKDRTNLTRYEGLLAKDSGPRQQAEDQRAIVNQDEATVKLDQALLAGAQYNLDKTIVRAPADGYVTNLALRVGARVTGQSPVMAFINTSETIIGVQIPQIYSRYVASGQPIEITFKTFPGEVFTGRVETVLQAIASGQTEVGGLAVAPDEIQPGPFIVRIKLDDPNVAPRLPAGSAGLAAIFTDHVKAAHVIRRVVLRQTAILNYFNPY
jgi:RND family efflux transporter MFP subunit